MKLKLEGEPIAEDCPNTIPEISVPEASSLNELLNEEPAATLFCVWQIWFLPGVSK